MTEGRSKREFRHTCPQCGDILVGDSEDAVVQKVIEHSRKLHDTNVLDLLSLDELSASVRSEYESYWAQVEHLMATNQLTTILEAKLCDREREVVDFVVHGFSNKEIAKRLYISERTVSTHLVNIYEKLGVHSRAALVAVVRAADRAIEASLRPARVSKLGPFFPSQRS